MQPAAKTARVARTTSLLPNTSLKEAHSSMTAVHETRYEVPDQKASMLVPPMSRVISCEMSGGGQS